MGDKLGLRPAAPVGEGLVAFAHDILREGRAAVANPELADAVAVHDVRKAMKRWRALLRLLEPLVGADARRLRHEARDLAHELATARDRQSALDALADLGDAEMLSPRSRAAMRAKLDVDREAAEAIALSDDMRGRLVAALEAGGRAVEHWPLDAIAFWQVADALADGYARARNAIPLWPDADDEALHEFRQRVVVHRYQIPLVAPLWPRLGRLWVAEAQRLREQLGAHQDLAVLAALTAPHQPLARWRSRLLDPIAARKRAHAAAAERLAGRLFAERPRAFRRRIMTLWEGLEKGAA
jgi:CHAD domain-containing protein